jgi:DNA helicase HerA-like ATPase
VGVYFVTQNPLDIPDRVLGQLGNRFQHALRAFTPRDQKAVKAAATTMRENPRFSAEQAISELAVGEALVSTLDEKGRPNVTERAFILPPRGQIGPIDEAARKQLIQNSIVAGMYEKTVNRESAYEMLKAKAAQQAQAEPAPEKSGGWGDVLGTVLGGGGGRRQGVAETLAKSAARAIGSEVGRQIIRGVLGSLLGGGRRR